jgi:hypothetical protein
MVGGTGKFHIGWPLKIPHAGEAAATSVEPPDAVTLNVTSRACKLSQ